MVKYEVIGMLDVAKNNPVIKATADTPNYSFIESDGILYLIANTLSGDDCYREDVVIPAGEYLNGFQVDAWVGKKLFIDGKHIEGGVDALKVGDTLVASDGKLAKGAAAGVHFVVTDTGLMLTEKAIKARVVIA